MHSGGFFIGFHSRLYGVKIFFAYKRRYSVGNYYVTKFIFTYVLAVSENTEHGVIFHFVSFVFNTSRG